MEELVTQIESTTQPQSTTTSTIHSLAKSTYVPNSPLLSSPIIPTRLSPIDHCRIAVPCDFPWSDASNTCLGRTFLVLLRIGSLSTGLFVACNSTSTGADVGADVGGNETKLVGAGGWSWDVGSTNAPGDDSVDSDVLWCVHIGSILRRNFRFLRAPPERQM